MRGGFIAKSEAFGLAPVECNGGARWSALDASKSRGLPGPTHERLRHRATGAKSWLVTALWCFGHGVVSTS